MLRAGVLKFEYVLQLGIKLPIHNIKDKLELLRLKHLFTTNLFRMAN